MREACGTRDENEEHEALFVLVLPPRLALFAVKKVRSVSLLVFAFVRVVVVVVAPLLLVKEVIIITERERFFPRTDQDQNVVIP